MTESISLNELKKMEFFQDIPSGVVQTILNEGNVVGYGKKEVIFHAKAELNAIYVILSGKVMLYNITKHGNRKIVFILGKGRLLNQNVVSKKPMPLFGEALNQVRLLKISGPVFEHLMDRHPELSRSVMKEYERYLWRMSHQLKNTTGNMQMERKIAAKLWKLGRDFGVDTEEGVKLDFEMTITLMADMIGAPRENVSRACKNLSDRNLITYKNKCFVISDPEKLAEFYKM